MKDELLIFISLFISIGSITFLIQNTDFIYEYLSLFLRTLKIKSLENFFKFAHYEQNSSSFENYISFLGSVFGVKNNFFGFLCRLLTCFLCLNCFLSLVLSFFIFESFILYIFPCFVGAVLIYLFLFLTKKKIFE